MTAQLKVKPSDTLSRIAANVLTAKSMSKYRDVFTEELLASVKWSDFDEVPEEIYSELLTHSFEFIQEREPGKPKIAIHSPKFKDAASLNYGPFTVIEILNDNMPFLLDSLLGELHDRHILIHQVLHPILHMKRGKEGQLQEIYGRNTDEAVQSDTESFITLHVDRMSEELCEEIEAELLAILGRVQVVVNDWLSMRNRLTRVATRLSTNTPRVPVDQLSESIQFLRWMGDNHFTFLGMQEFELKGKGKKAELYPKTGTGLGLLRDPNLKVLRRGKELVHMTAEVRKFFFGPDPIIITKANIKSDVHRRVHMDYIGLKIYDEKGKITGELRIVGLFTSSAYANKVANVPLLRQKLDYVLDHSGFVREGHSGKALSNIIETFPRDELFQISNSQLAHFAREIEKLDHSPRVKVLQRVDEFDRFVSLLVFLPRDQYSTESRTRVGDYLAEKFDGRVSAYYPYFAEGPYIRIHYIIGRDSCKTPKCERAMLEADVESMTRRFEDRMRDVLSPYHDFEDTNVLIEQYEDAFPVGYRDIYGTERLVEDIHAIEEMDGAVPTAVNFYQREGEPLSNCHVTLYNLGDSIPLSKRVPIFENLGFNVIEERSYIVTPRKGRGQLPICQHMMKLSTKDGRRVDLEKLDEHLVSGFMAVWEGDAANDGYNQLISLLTVDWRDAAMMRGFGAYLRQINVPYDQDYLVQTLKHHHKVTKDLIDLFHCRFDPAKRHGVQARAKRLLKRIDNRLRDIPCLDEDRILRHFCNLIEAGLRTNFYQIEPNGKSPETIAFKFDSSKIDGVPEPRPFREIFVYSPKVEGVHLRFGKIARGGLRWSDRHQDFRTEILGLVKAQLVKNTVIVPTGSKGGFVPKNIPENASREQFMASGTEAYKSFINALLSLTDNLQGNVVVPPQNTVRHDGDDPYLVVAADKGTATFSDIANEISCRRGFWLGDAFASGGSQGYDHKKMGITARGGWEAVKRHFREMNINIQRQPFTAIGVGDMSGDVFGNGMLLSKATKLVAAFDHRDIFIDPDPNPKQSWKERKRLFDMGRCSWQDYDKKLISKGGGVFSRSSKSIKLSNEICERLNISAKTITPNQLIKAILKAEADLLWFGGIGTYVRGAEESNSNVGDRANDGIRVSTDELNIKVIGEGANLGLTQQARIDFAMNGGHVNTDAIDNSAGVNSSDLEVNIKIALGQAVSDGKLSVQDRNKVLSSMTDQVAERCLINNYRQTLTLSLGEKNGLEDFDFQRRLMRNLEVNGLMNRDIENLPVDAVIAERMEAGQPLTRPELSTLLGFAKIDLYNQLIESELVDDRYFRGALNDYFPEKMQKPFAQEIRKHPLRREIVGTQLTNDIINRGGSTMAIRLMDETGRGCHELAAGFSAAMAVLGLDDVYAALDAVDNKVAGDVQLELYHKLQFITRRKTAWFMVNGDFTSGLESEIKAYKAGMKRYMKVAESSLAPCNKEHLDGEYEAMVNKGVPEDLARAMIKVSLRADGLDAVLAARRSNSDVEQITKILGILESKLRFAALVRATEDVPVRDVYDRWSLNALVSRIQVAKRGLSAQLARNNTDVSAWISENEALMTRTATAISEILDGCDVGLSKLIVAVGQVDELAQ